jgi:hypothetical protein
VSANGVQVHRARLLGRARRHALHLPRPHVHHEDQVHGRDQDDQGARFRHLRVPGDPLDRGQLLAAPTKENGDRDAGTRLITVQILISGIKFLLSNIDGQH